MCSHLVQQYINDKILALEYCPTKEQAADLLTKEVTVGIFLFLLQLCNEW